MKKIKFFCPWSQGWDKQEGKKRGLNTLSGERKKKACVQVLRA